MGVRGLLARREAGVHANGGTVAEPRPYVAHARLSACGCHVTARWRCRESGERAGTCSCGHSMRTAQKGLRASTCCVRVRRGRVEPRTLFPSGAQSGGWLVMESTPRGHARATCVRTWMANLGPASAVMSTHGRVCARRSELGLRFRKGRVCASVGRLTDVVGVQRPPSSSSRR